MKRIHLILWLLAMLCLCISVVGCQISEHKNGIVYSGEILQSSDSVSMYQIDGGFSATIH